MSLTLTALQPAKLIPRVDIAAPNLRLEVFQHGIRATWEMASACPCGRKLTHQGISADTREKQPECVGCKGTGIIYHSAQEVRVVYMQAESRPERFRLYGESGQGGVRFTFLPEHLPSFLDRLTLIDAVITYKERALRKGTIDALTYAIVKRSITLGSGTPPTTPLVKVVGVLHMNRADASGTFIAGELVEGTDFDVTSDGKIDWTKGIANGKAPAIGAPFGLHYFTRPRYIVRSFPQEWRDTWIGEKAATPYHERLLVEADCWLEWHGGVDGL